MNNENDENEKKEGNGSYGILPTSPIAEEFFMLRMKNLDGLKLSLLCRRCRKCGYQGLAVLDR